MKDYIKSVFYLAAALTCGQINACSIPKEITGWYMVLAYGINFLAFVGFIFLARAGIRATIRDAENS